MREIPLQLQKLLRAALTLGALALVLCEPSLVSAQTIDPFIGDNALTRTVPRRDENEKPLWINREDCLANDTLKFDLVASVATDDKFQVWVGSNCVEEENRFGENTDCWLVHDGRAEDRNFSVSIRAQDIVAEVPSIRGPTLSTGNATVCNKAEGREGLVTFYFMYVDSDNNVKGNHAEWNFTGIDIRGPSPPRDLSAATGENGLRLSWDTSNASSLIGYRFYCFETGGPVQEPECGTLNGIELCQANSSNRVIPSATTQSADAGILDAGAAVPSDNAGNPNTGDAAATDGGASDNSGDRCFTSSKFEPRKLPPAGIEEFACGELDNGQATSGFATRGRNAENRLNNGVEYAVMVAAVDDVNNPGTLSEPVCGAPANLIDFWEFYKIEGGAGGGGFCSLRPGPSERSTTLRFMSLLFLLGMAFTARRLRRKQ